MAAQNPRVVIIGAGFGGLYAARTLAGQNVGVLLIDRNNYHTFTPLLYQVATSGLEPEEIAYPVRGIFKGNGNTRFLLGEVVDIDTVERSVAVRTNGVVRHEPYDYLIMAAGSVTHYLNIDGADTYGFGLKSLSESVALRNHILSMFERAAWTEDPAKREALTTLTVIGGGATGLEMAGALFELYDKVLKKEHAFLANVKPRVVLVEASDRLLLTFPENLQRAALEQLTSLGVEVVLGSAVRSVEADRVTLSDGRVIPTFTVVWSAGVKASPLAQMLNVDLARNGRVPVKPTMEAIGLERVYVVGDMAYLEDANEQPYPMLIPVAKQQGILAAKNILRRERGEAEVAFRYVDRGIMATIGRSRAVAYIFNRLPLRGFVAWLAWLGLHLVALMGFRNRLNVFVNWAYNYFTYDRSARIILVAQGRRDVDGGLTAETAEAEAAPASDAVEA